jgi:dihydrofolate reductase
VHEALAQAKAAAGDKDVRLGGVTATVRGFLQAGLIDELHLVISPVVLGSGEALWAGLDVAALGYQCTEHAGSTEALHVVLTKQA